MAHVHIAERLEELDSFLAAWDRLAVQQRRPFLRPDWLLAWWRALSEGEAPGSGLRVIVVHDHQGLAGVAPLYIELIELVRAHELPRHARERLNQGRVRLRVRTRLVEAGSLALARAARSASR